MPFARNFRAISRNHPFGAAQAALEGITALQVGEDVNNSIN